MPFSSSVSSQLLSLIQAVCMLGARWLKVRNGQQQSGFMLILLTKIWLSAETAQIWMRAVRDGLLLVSAPRTQSIWLVLQSVLAIVGEVAKYVSCTLHASMIVDLAIRLCIQFWYIRVYVSCSCYLLCHVMFLVIFFISCPVLLGLHNSISFGSYLLFFWWIINIRSSVTVFTNIV